MTVVVEEESGAFAELEVLSVRSAVGTPITACRSPVVCWNWKGRRKPPLTLSLSPQLSFASKERGL